MGTEVPSDIRCGFNLPYGEKLDVLDVFPHTDGQFVYARYPGSNNFLREPGYFDEEGKPQKGNYVMFKPNHGCAIFDMSLEERQACEGIRAKRKGPDDEVLATDFTFGICGRTPEICGGCKGEQKALRQELKVLVAESLNNDLPQRVIDRIETSMYNGVNFLLRIVGKKIHRRAGNQEPLVALDRFLKS